VCCHETDSNTRNGAGVVEMKPVKYKN